MDKAKTDWLLENRKLVRKIKSEHSDVLKLLSFCHTTTLKGEILRMSEEYENNIITLLYDEESTTKEIESIKKEVQLFKSELKNPNKDQSYYIRIETVADKIEGRITQMKQEKMCNFEQIDSQYEELERELGLLEKNLHIYEQRVEVGLEAPEGHQGTGHGPRSLGGDLNSEVKIEALEELLAQRSPVESAYSARTRLS